MEMLSASLALCAGNPFFYCQAEQAVEQAMELLLISNVAALMACHINDVGMTNISNPYPYADIILTMVSHKSYNRRFISFYSH